MCPSAAGVAGIAVVLAAAVQAAAAVAAPGVGAVMYPDDHDSDDHDDPEGLVVGKPAAAPDAGIIVAVMIAVAVYVVAAMIYFAVKSAKVKKSR